MHWGEEVLTGRGEGVDAVRRHQRADDAGVLPAVEAARAQALRGAHRARRPAVAAARDGVAAAGRGAGAARAPAPAAGPLRLCQLPAVRTRARCPGPGRACGWTPPPPRCPTPTLLDALRAELALQARGRARLPRSAQRPAARAARAARRRGRRAAWPGFWVSGADGADAALAAVVARHAAGRRAAGDAGAPHARAGRPRGRRARRRGARQPAAVHLLRRQRGRRRRPPWPPPTATPRNASRRRRRNCAAAPTAAPACRACAGWRRKPRNARRPDSSEHTMHDPAHCTLSTWSAPAPATPSC